MSLVPYVVEQTARGERSYDIFSRLLNDRIIVLSEDVNSASASVIVAQLLYLEGQDPEKDIYFYINSPGGSISDGMATTTHAQLSPEELADVGIQENTIRLSIGTEHVDDIIADLDQAFAAVE